MAGRPRKHPEFPLPPPETLGARLAAERRRLGVTQEELAKSLGIAPTALRNYEQDRTTIKTSVLDRMRRASIDVEFVVFGRDREALEPLDADLWKRVKAWDLANPNDVEGKPLNEYYRYQRVTLLYRWLRSKPHGEADIEERLNKFVGARAA